MTHYPEIRLKKIIWGKFDHFQVIEDVLCGDYVIFKGYRTNFASIPRLLWPFFPPHGRMTIPSVAHDYAYDSRLREDSLGAYKARKLADLEFFVGMINVDVPFWQAITVYAFVRIFGKKYWET